MSSELEIIQELLAHMGVAAEVKLNEMNEKVIIIETLDYERRQNWIESWFTLVEQHGGYSYFRVRERGTGQTM